MTIDYRICTTTEEFSRIADLERRIWGTSPEDTISFHIMRVIQHIGGLMLGAFDGDEMIGMAVATPTKYRGRLWSHMAGVLPEYQGQGIGERIKREQKQWAKANGYTEIRWSVDPAMRRNAHFNFHLLGAKTTIYHINFYGSMSDGINAGVPSDRFEVIWQLDGGIAIPDIPDDYSFLLVDENQHPVISAKPSDAFHAVICPYDFQAIKTQSRELIFEWREAMREVLQSAFADGYQVVDFVTNREDKTCWYILYRA